MRKITSWKGGRSERIYARMTKEAKAKLLARVKHEGYKSLADWLEAQAMAQPTLRGSGVPKPPPLTQTVGGGFLADQQESE